MAKIIDTAIVEIRPDLSRFAAEASSQLNTAFKSVEASATKASQGIESSFSKAFQGASKDISAVPVEVGKLASSAKRDLASIGPVADETGSLISRAFRGASASAANSLSALAGTLKGTLGATAGAVAGIVGIGAIIAKGFTRLTSIEDAQAKLKGLGKTAEEVKSIMDESLKSVLGTSFGLGEAATVAANAVTAGIKPGKELARTLRLVVGTAAAAGTDLLSISRIFDKVKTSNKVFNDTLQELGDRGIPIVEELSKVLKVPPDEISDLAASGAINFKNFQDAMESTKNVAEALGKTTTGSFKNLGAAIGRLGAVALGPIFPSFKFILQDLTKVLDSLPKGLAAVEKSKTFEFLRTAIAQLGKTIKLLKDTFVELFNAVKPVLEVIAAAAWETFKGLINAIKEIFEKLNPAIKALNHFLGENKNLITVLTGLYVAYAIAEGAVAIATGLWAAAVVTLDVALAVLTSPIILIVAATALLVVGVIEAYRHFKIFRNVVDDVFNFFKDIVLNSIDFIVDQFLELKDQTIDVVNAIRNAFNSVTGFFTAFGPVVSAVFNFFKDIVLNSIDFIIEQFIELKDQTIDLINTVRSIFNSIIDFFSSLRPVISAVFNFFKDIVLNSIDFIIDQFINLKDETIDLVNTIRNTFNSIIDFFKRLPGRILGALGDVGHVLFDAGKKLMGGLADGITSAFDTVKDSVTGILGWIKDALPGSPIKLGPLSGNAQPEFGGEKIGQRLADGLRESIPDVTAASRQVISAIGSNLGMNEFKMPGFAGVSTAQSNSSAGQLVSFGPGAINVTFAGVVPTDAEAQSTGESVGIGIAAALARRDVRTAIRAV